MFVQQASNAPWPERAVHDTVAAVARQLAYRRTLGESLAQQFWRWFGRLMKEVFDLFRDSHSGRTVAIALLVLLLILVVVRVWVNARASADARTGGGADRAYTRGADAWHEAERLAAAGDFTRAAHALFAALLASCASRGELRLHPSKTTGDYARELRWRGAASQRGFQTFRSRYDRIIYGAIKCTESDYTALLSDARPLLGREQAA